MWLLMAAPVVSQLLAPASGMHGMAMPMDDAAAMHCGEHAGHGGDPTPLQPHNPSLSACGYCDLLGHSPVMASVAWLASAAPPLPIRLLPVAPARRLSRQLFLAAAPRGPPVNANA